MKKMSWVRLAIIILLLIVILVGLLLLRAYIARGLRMEGYNPAKGYIWLDKYKDKVVPTEGIFDPAQGTVSVCVNFVVNHPRRDHAIFHTDDSRYVLFVDTYHSSSGQDILRIGARAGGNRPGFDSVSKTKSQPEVSIIIDNDGSLKDYAVGARYCSVSPFPEGEWHLVTMTWSGYPEGIVRIYLDGMLKGEKAYNSDYDDGAPLARSLSIGIRPSQWRGLPIKVRDVVVGQLVPATDMSLDAGGIKIWDLRLYRRALTESEIRKITSR
jgi:hypothetical protein